jgi:uncharacterized protein YlaI
MSRFAHILLFVCPECDLPIAISRINNEKNLEAVDAEVLHIKCSYCDKSAEVSALTAKKHYVETWP